MTDCFKTSAFEHAVVLTLMVDSLTSRNAAWIKQEVQAFLKNQRPRHLILNLNNIQHLDSIGLGVLISLNTNSKRFGEYAIMGLHDEVLRKLENSRLNRVFHILSPQAPCFFCKSRECLHLAQLEAKQLEFLAADFPEPEVPPLGQRLQKLAKSLTQKLNPEVLKTLPPPQPQPEVPLALTPEDQKLQRQRQGQRWRQQLLNYGMIGLASAVFVGTGGLLVWLAVKTDLVAKLEARKIKPKEAMSQSELLDRFDKNQDGLLNLEDWKMLKSNEKLLLINQGFVQRKGRLERRN